MKQKTINKEIEEEILKSEDILFNYWKEEYKDQYPEYQDFLDDLDEEIIYDLLDKATSLAFQKSRQKALKDVLGMIEDIDIELFLTDIKDKKGNKAELSDELMEIISLWWDKKSEELTSKIKKELGDKK